MITVSYLVLWIVFGGGAPVGLGAFAVLALTGSMMLGACVWWGGLVSWSTLDRPAKAFIIFCCLAPVVQLVPMPPDWWHALPGRGLPTETLATVDAAQSWRPLTLAVEPTFRTALVTIWLAAFLLSLLRLSAWQWHRLLGVLLILGLFNVAIGVAQLITASPLLQFYPDAFFPFMNGLFANKNHNGLFIALTLLVGWAWCYGERGWSRERLALVAPIAIFLLVSLLVTFSRAAVVLGVIALVFLVYLSSVRRSRARPSRQSRRARLAAVGCLAMLAFLLLVLGSSDMGSRALARFQGVRTDDRWTLARYSLPLVREYFPFGAGVGSFTAVFPSHEQLAWVEPTYVNHVHDDLMEQVIELGVAAPLGWCLAVAAVAIPVRTAWRRRFRPAGRLALIGAAMLFLIAAHSLVDYPLRRPGIAVTFMVALAALMQVGRRADERESGREEATGRMLDRRLSGDAEYE